jgi:hypothetical protein
VETSELDGEGNVTVATEVQEDGSFAWL